MGAITVTAAKPTVAAGEATMLTAYIGGCEFPSAVSSIDVQWLADGGSFAQPGGPHPPADRYTNVWHAPDRVDQRSSFTLQVTIAIAGKDPDDRSKDVTWSCDGDGTVVVVPASPSPPPG